MLAFLCASSALLAAAGAPAPPAPARRVLFSRSADGTLRTAASDAAGAAADAAPGLAQAAATSTLTVTLTTGAKSILTHTDALFGIPAYQSGTAGLLYQPQGADNNNGRVTGCAPFTDTKMAKRIVLLDRSSAADTASCFFAQKVANAQASGAYGVVMVDSLGVCDDPADVCATNPAYAATCRSQCPWRQTPQCQCTLPVMADNGGGSAVSIPAMLVSREDGAWLKSYASQAATLPLVGMRWDIPAADGSVLLVMWQDSIDLAASAFRDTWALYVPYLATTTRFAPHFYVRAQATCPPHASRARARVQSPLPALSNFSSRSSAPPFPFPSPTPQTSNPQVIDGQQAGCDVHPAVCASQCVNGGYYCAVDPDGDPDSGVSGGDVVLENLRSQCAWQEANSTFASDYGQRWWRYAHGYEAACSDPARWGAACSAAQMRAAGFDDGALARIAACVAASNATAAATAGKGTCAANPFNRDVADCDWTNKLLQLELNLAEQMGIQRLPSMLVEGIVVSGNTASPNNVLGAVCTGFGSGASLPGGAIPAVCACGGAAGSDVKACLAGLGPAAAPAPAPAGMPGWAVAILLFSLFALAAAGGACWYIQRTRGQVEEMFEEYSSLPEGPGAGGSAGAGGEGGSLQQAPGGGFVGKGGRAVRAPKFASTASGAGGGLLTALPPLPDWLAGLLQPPEAHAHTRLPNSVGEGGEGGGRAGAAQAPGFAAAGQ